LLERQWKSIDAAPVALFVIIAFVCTCVVRTTSYIFFNIFVCKFLCNSFIANLLAHRFV